MSNDAIDFSLLIGPQVPARSFKAGETIFQEGDPANELYVIQTGRVAIQTGNRLLGTLNGNSIFGETALIDSTQRQRGRGDRCHAGSGVGKAVPVPDQPDTLLRAQCHAHLGAPAAQLEQGDMTAARSRSAVRELPIQFARPAVERAGLQ